MVTFNAHYVSRYENNKKMIPKLLTKSNLFDKVMEPHMLNIYQLCFPRFSSYGEDGKKEIIIVTNFQEKKQGKF
jgi:predicted Ser/Thr protein kinase